MIRSLSSILAEEQTEDTAPAVLPEADAPALEDDTTTAAGLDPDKLNDLFGLTASDDSEDDMEALDVTSVLATLRDEDEGLVSLGGTTALADPDGFNDLFNTASDGSDDEIKYDEDGCVIGPDGERYCTDLDPSTPVADPAPVADEDEPAGAPATDAPSSDSDSGTTAAVKADDAPTGFDAPPQVPAPTGLPADGPSVVSKKSSRLSRLAQALGLVSSIVEDLDD